MVSLEMQTLAPEPATFRGLKGVDLGERSLAAATTPSGATQFFPSGAVRHQGEAFQRVRSRLQAKGTRGAKLRLRRLIWRERRFKANVNQLISKAIVVPGTS